MLLAQPMLGVQNLHATSRGCVLPTQSMHLGHQGTAPAISNQHAKVKQPIVGEGNKETAIFLLVVLKQCHCDGLGNMQGARILVGVTFYGTNCMVRIDIGK